MIVQKEGKYYFKDCGKFINMVSRLNDQKQERVSEGAIIDFGTQIKYHCVKCFAPDANEQGREQPFLHAVHFNDSEVN